MSFGENKKNPVKKHALNPWFNKKCDNNNNKKYKYNTSISELEKTQQNHKLRKIKQDLKKRKMKKHQPTPNYLYRLYIMVKVHMYNLYWITTNIRDNSRYFYKDSAPPIVYR